MKPIATVCFCAIVVYSATGCTTRFDPLEPAEIAIVKTHVQKSRQRYGVEVKPCKTYKTSSLEAGELNCFVENSRFQSMVNPEKMLPEPKSSAGSPASRDGVYELQ